MPVAMMVDHPRGSQEIYDQAMTQFRRDALTSARMGFEEVIEAPIDGWHATVAASDSTNPAIERWYDYGFLSHLLTPRPRVYAVRTADGRYAKLKILSYYCPGASPGCMTFRYVFQGDGSRSFEPGE
jgi:hypothetical protein